MRDLVETKLANWGMTSEEMFAMNDDDLFIHFCDVFSLKEPVRIPDPEVVKENDKLKEELKRLYGVDRPFICGDVGEQDDQGLREYYLIAPAYGAEGATLYKKHKELK
jgi:hypothetical protein